MKNFCFYIFIFFISCKSDENIKITSKKLDLEIKSFIEKVNNNPSCKSANIMVEIFKEKIIISTTQPVYSADFIGSTLIDNKNTYFYSSSEYSNYLIVRKKDFKILDANNDCHPSMDKILLIDKIDKNTFHCLPPPVDLTKNNRRK